MYLAILDSLDSSDRIALAALIVAGISAALSVTTARRQAREATVANALPTAIDLFRDFRQMRDARERVADLPANQRDPMSQLDREIVSLAYLLDNIGVLVAEKLVRPELVAGYMGTSVIYLWERLSPSIDAERQIRRARFESHAYLQYFEHLAETMREVDPEKVRANLKHWGDQSAGPSQAATRLRNNPQHPGWAA
jgi:hypothetical protein